MEEVQRSRLGRNRLILIGAAVIVLGGAAFAGWKYYSSPAISSPMKPMVSKMDASDADHAAMPHDVAGKKAGEPPVIDDAKPNSTAPEGMTWIPGGQFSMGTEEAGFSDTRPIHRVKVDGFWMDKTEVTNAQFDKFVRATGYITHAERKPKPEDYPGVPPEKLVAGSIVFTPPKDAVPLNDYMQWWAWYRSDYYQTIAAQGPLAANPTGPADSSDPNEPGIPKRVTKGGSFLCTDQYCARYMPGGRGKEAPDTGTNHLGFRLVTN